MQRATGAYWIMSCTQFIQKQLSKCEAAWWVDVGECNRWNKAYCPRTGELFNTSKLRYINEVLGYECNIIKCNRFIIHNSNTI